LFFPLIRKPGQRRKDIVYYHQDTAYGKSGVGYKIWNIQYFGSAPGSYHLADKIRALKCKITENGDRTQRNNDLDLFPYFRGKQIHKKINGHMGAGPETRAGAEEHHKYDTEKLYFFAPDYRTVDKIPHNHRPESNDDEDQQS
jgi:hypothetical protein